MDLPRPAMPAPPTLGAPPPDVPIGGLMGAGDQVQAIMDRIRAAVEAAMLAAAQAVLDCEGRIRAAISAGLDTAHQLFEDAGIAADVPVLALLGWAAQIVQSLGCPPITPEELGDIAATMPWPGEIERPPEPPSEPLIPPGFRPPLGDGGTPGGLPFLPWPPFPPPWNVFLPPGGVTLPRPVPPVYVLPPGAPPPYVLPLPPGPGGIGPVPGPGGGPIGPPPTWPVFPFPPGAPGGGGQGGIGGAPPGLGITPGGAPVGGLPPWPPIFTPAPPGIPPGGGLPPWPGPPGVPTPIGTPPSVPMPPPGTPGFPPIDTGGGQPPVWPKDCPPPCIQVTCPAPVVNVVCTPPAPAPPGPVEPPIEIGPEGPPGDTPIMVQPSPGIPPQIFPPSPTPKPPSMDDLLREAMGRLTAVFSGPMGTPDQCRELPAALAALDRWRTSLEVWVRGDYTTYAITPESALGELIRALPSLIREPVAKILVDLVHLYQWGVYSLSGLIGCPPSEVIGPMVARALLSIVERWTGAEFPEARIRLDYAAGQACPQGIPTIAEATPAYLRGHISREIYECWVKSHGRVYEHQADIVQAQKPRPDALQTVALAARGHISAEDLPGVFRANTGGDATLLRDVQRLFDFVPPAGDLVRFMTRDSFDDEVARVFQYDAQFAEKFAGPARDWARAQGMTEAQFKYYWRAHWRLPSPTQAFEMLHRLRPGRIDEKLVTTAEHVRQLLEIDDLAPFWQDRLTAISYRPVTRIDLRQGFYQGAYSAEDVLEGLQDVGYSEESAALLLRSWVRLKVDWARNRPVVRRYRSGVATEDETRAALADLGVTGALADRVISEADQDFTGQSRVICVRAMRKRVLVGLLASDDARVDLLHMGFSPSQAHNYVSTWECERSLQGRVASAAQLCRWQDMGLLSEAEYGEALARLGYGQADIRRIMAECQVRAKERTRKEQERVTERERAKADRERAAEERQAQRDRMATARAERAARSLTRHDESVEKRLVKAARKIATDFGGEESDIRDAIDLQHSYLMDEKHWTALGAADVLVEMVPALKQRDYEDWSAALVDLVRGMPAMGGGDGGEGEGEGEGGAAG